MGIFAVACGIKAWRHHVMKLGTVAILLGFIMVVLGAVHIIASFREFGLI